MDSLNKYKFFCINVNSLNLSTATRTNNKFERKLLYILGHKPEFIILQDVRIGPHKALVERILNFNNFSNYQAIINSSNDSRGTLIAYKSSLNIKILNTYFDEDENLIILTIDSGAVIFNLVNIYLGTDAQNFNTLDLMRAYLENSGTHNILIFGDLNNYFDTKDVFYNNPVNDNTFRPPNPANLRKLNFIMSNLELMDVFRHKNPQAQTFSFKPFGNDNYMSRLDYCLASPIFKHNCNIEYGPIHSTLFDHAAVMCEIDTFKKITGIKKLKTTNLTLKV